MAAIERIEVHPQVAGFRPTEAQVVDFLKGQAICMIASVGPAGRPQAATVAFSQTPDLALVIGTDDHSRKTLNMQRDNRVAMVITDPDREYTVQLEGRAQQLELDDFDQHYATAHFAKLHKSLPFRDIKGQCYIKITPIWLRFTDCTANYPWAVTEFTF
jgi:uncharacterized protein YhbP (UPF0306 family)